MESGICGYKLLRSNLENDITTPYQIWGFNIGLFSFLDCAFAKSFSNKHKKCSADRRAGFRIHNPALIWDQLNSVLLSSKKGSKGEWKITLSTKKDWTLLIFREKFQ